MRSRSWVQTVLLAVPLLPALACGGSSPVQPQQVTAPSCNSDLWAHVYDPSRLEVVDDCRTVTGEVASQHTSADGDVDSELAVDPAFSNLLNGVNASKLHGHLQVEEICQGPVKRSAFDACRGYNGTVLVPPVGAHVSVTGAYVRDRNHGWMEIHPASHITALR
jgi:hypothetical protein